MPYRFLSRLDYISRHSTALSVTSGATVQFWTKVQTWTSPNGTQVRSKVQAQGWTEQSVRSSVQIVANSNEPVRTGSNVE
jgi:hypothetical protein